MQPCRRAPLLHPRNAQDVGGAGGAEGDAGGDDDALAFGGDALLLRLRHGFFDHVAEIIDVFGLHRINAVGQLHAARDVQVRRQAHDGHGRALARGA